MNETRGRPRGRQPFKDQKGGQRKDTIRKLKEFVDTYAGGDFSIFQTVLAKQDGRMEGNIRLSASESMIYDCSMVTRLLEGINALVAQTSDYQKRQYVSIFRHAGLSRKFLASKGFRIGERGTL